MAQLLTRENAVEPVRAAQALSNPVDRLKALNDLFRDGRPPDHPLDGRYVGQLLGLDIAPGLTQVMRAITSRWMPWKGKTFDASSAMGDNIFQRSSYLVAHLYWPLYRGYRDVGRETYRAFAFRTYVAAGRDDADRQVLKIDYDIEGNPELSIRRVLDELAQIGDGYYLGKAHVKWWWGRWQLVAYFSLSKA